MFATKTLIILRIQDGAVGLTGWGMFLIIFILFILGSAIERSGK